MLLVCPTQGCISEKDPDGPSLQVGEPLPQFEVMLNDGKQISTETFMGKTGVIVFFNTGCSDCQKELPVVQQLWDKIKNDDNIVMTVIARQESEKEILEYWEKTGLTMPFSPQEDTKIYNLFAPSVIPRIYISDPKGIIRYSYDDVKMPTLEDLEQAILTM